MLRDVIEVGDIGVPPECKIVLISSIILCNMTVVAITSSTERNARRYVSAMESAGSETRLLLPVSQGDAPTGDLMRGIGGLLLTGGPDVHPRRYGQQPDPDARLQLRPELDDLEFRVLEYALTADMPVLAICRGMQVLNVAFGGKLIQDLRGHRNDDPDDEEHVSHLDLRRPGCKRSGHHRLSRLFQSEQLPPSGPQRGAESAAPDEHGVQCRRRVSGGVGKS